MTIVPMTVAILDKVPVDEAGIASAVMDTMQQIGRAIGLAGLVTHRHSRPDQQLPGATYVLGEAKARGDHDTVTNASNALVHGYSAAYTASLMLWSPQRWSRSSS